MILHLGVVDIPYVAREPAAQMRWRARQGKHSPAGAKTTGDVAEILEAKYHVMQTFFDLHETEILGALERGIEGTLENVLVGGRMNANVFGEGESRIKSLFNQFLLTKEMDRLGIPGVPTKAAREGVSHRFKSRRGNKNRPSFIDTGLFETSMRAWVDV